MHTIKNIRQGLFGLTQTEFAKAIGVAQSTVSRWESGAGARHDEIKKIRNAAIERKLKWDDSLLFEEPAQ